MFSNQPKRVCNKLMLSKMHASSSLFFLVNLFWITAQHSVSMSSVCTYAHANVRTCAHAHVCTCVHARVCTCAHAHVCTCVHAHVCTILPSRSLSDGGTAQPTTCSPT